MPKTSRKKCTPTRRKVTIQAIQDQDQVQVPTIKTEDHADVTTRTYQPIHPLHLDELVKIWDNDTRMPTATSRRAWALARGLNPANVNNWWYRRRKALAKKLGTRAPLDAYELDVGVPPVIVFKVEDDGEDMATDADVSAEVSSEPLSGSVSEDTCIDSFSVGLSDSLGSGIDSLTSSGVITCPALAKPAHISGKDVDEGAYTHFLLSPTLRFSSHHPCSRPSSPYRDRMGSLPPSSPPPPSPPPSPSLPSCLLFLPESNYGLDTCARVGVSTVYGLPHGGDKEIALALLSESHSDLEHGFLNSFNPLGDAQIPSCSSAPIVKLPFFCLSPEESILSGATEKQRTTDLEDLQALTNEADYAPWCLDGFRVAYDGSLIGFCSRCYVNMRTSSPC